MADGWSFLGWGAREFFKLLEDRLRLHGKVLGSDELEFVGFYIRHGSLRAAAECEADYLSLDLSYSDWFDELDRHLLHGGDPPSTAVVRPVMLDLRRSLERDEPVFVETDVPKPSSRRAPCPCGSGKRYKNCHGRGC